MSRQNITITLTHGALERDVVDKTAKLAKLNKYAGGDPNEIGDDREADSQFGAVVPDEQFMVREFQNALSELCVEASKYMHAESANANDMLAKTGSYTYKDPVTNENKTVDSSFEVKFSFPANWNGAMATPLANIMHEYLVARCMVEWFRYTMPSQMQAQMGIAASARQDFKKALRARTRLVASSATSKS